MFLTEDPVDTPLRLQVHFSIPGQILLLILNLAQICVLILKSVLVISKCYVVFPGFQQDLVNPVLQGWAKILKIRQGMGLGIERDWEMELEWDCDWEWIWDWDCEWAWEWDEWSPRDGPP